MLSNLANCYKTAVCFYLCVHARIYEASVASKLQGDVSHFGCPKFIFTILIILLSAHVSFSDRRLFCRQSVNFFLHFRLQGTNFNQTGAKCPWLKSLFR